jgi:hypothetical protein
MQRLSGRAGTMPSATFWRLVDRLQLPDTEALELISYPGKIGPSGKRPRFRLSTRQTHLASYLPEIEVTLQALGGAPGMVGAPEPVSASSGARARQAAGRTGRGKARATCCNSSTMRSCDGRRDSCRL